jgi:uncharacterized protein YbjT (DUF2867 family)
MIALFGATGRIGGAAARALRERGVRTRAVVRDAARGGALRGCGCELAVADVDDTAAVRRALDGTDAALVIMPTRPQAPDARAAMRATVAALAAALHASPPPVVVAISDYGAHLESGTGVTMLFRDLEQALGDLSGVTFLRSAEHMQNLGRQIPAALRTGVLGSLHHPLTKRFPTVSAPDVGRVAADLLTDSERPRVLHVEGPERYTPLEVAATLSDLAGREIVARELPRVDWVGVLGNSLSESYAALIVELFDAHNAGRIDADGEVERGTTTLREALAPLVAAARS